MLLRWQACVFVSVDVCVDDCDSHHSSSYHHHDSHRHDDPATAHADAGGDDGRWNAAGIDGVAREDESACRAFAEAARGAVDDRQQRRRRRRRRRRLCSWRRLLH